MRESSPKKYIPFFATLTLIVLAVLAAYWAGRHSGAAAAKNYHDQARVLANLIDREADCLRMEKNEMRQRTEPRRPAALYQMIDLYQREQFCLRSNGFPHVWWDDVYDVSGARWHLEMPAVTDPVWSAFRAPARLSTPGPYGSNSGIPSYRIDLIDGTTPSLPHHSSK